MDAVAIDFETDDQGRPWQLGAVAFEYDESGKAAPGEMHDWRFESGGLMAYWEEIYGFLAGKTLIAHNIACEKTILTRLAPITPWGPWIDTLKIAKKRYPKLASHALGDLCMMFGCVPVFEGRTWHDGLYDALACGMLYEKIA